MNARFITDLRTCNVRKGTLDKGQGYYEIRDKTDPKAEVIRITFDNKEEFFKWGLCFMESIKSDQQLKELAQKERAADEQAFEEQRRVAQEAEQAVSRQTQARKSVVDMKRR